MFVITIWVYFRRHTTWPRNVRGLVFGNTFFGHFVLLVVVNGKVVIFVGVCVVGRGTWFITNR